MACVSKRWTFNSSVENPAGRPRGCFSNHASADLKLVKAWYTLTTS
jgi:hypothetical protein